MKRFAQTALAALLTLGALSASAQKTATYTPPDPMKRADGAFKDGSYQRGQQTPKSGTIDKSAPTGQGYQGQYADGKDGTSQNTSGQTTIEKSSKPGTPSQQSMKTGDNTTSGSKEPKSGQSGTPAAGQKMKEQTSTDKSAK